jgi:hypothetical protein
LIKEVGIVSKKRGWKGARFESNKGGSTDRRVFNIKFLEEYCNQKYKLERYETNEITKEGLLLIGKLKPKVSTLPEFWFRWDAKEQELDVDMYGDVNSKENWDNEKNGYKGHHTEKYINGRRNFKVLINIPKLKVFKGVISFNLEFENEIINKIKLGDKAKLE